MDARQEAVKRYLSQHRSHEVDLRIAGYMKAIAQEELTNLQGKRYSGRTREKIEDFKKKLKQGIRDAQRRENKALQGMKEIETVIEKLEDPQQKEVLKQRYLQRETWETIAESIYYSTEYTHQIHRKALSAIADGWGDIQSLQDKEK